MTRNRKMHQTTLRFSNALWAAVEQEAAGAGVSTAQFVRESVLWRMAYEAGRRAQAEPAQPTRAEAAQARARDEFDSSSALYAQGQVTRAKAKQLRERMAGNRADLQRERDRGSS